MFFLYVFFSNIHCTWPSATKTHTKVIKMFIAGADHLILMEGWGGKLCQDRLFIFSMSSARKFIYMYTKTRIFSFNFKSQKKLKQQNFFLNPQIRGGGRSMRGE